MSIAGPAMLLVFGYLAWVNWGAPNIDRVYYSLKIEDLIVPPQPPWIKVSVVEEVYRGSSLKDVSLLDHNASPTIAQAFDVHPWVRGRPRVIPTAGGKVQVTFEYRRPIAMVYLNPYSPLLKKISNEDSNKGIGKAELSFLAVDMDAVLLPSGERQPYDVNEYIQICVQDGATPSGPVGAPFGDQRVADGVRLATILDPVKRDLQILAIYVYRDPISKDGTRFLLEITTKPIGDNPEKRLYWGHSPGAEISGELSPEEKLRKLGDAIRNSAPTTDFINISGLTTGR